MKKTERHNPISKQEWLFLVTVFFISAIVRLKINFSTEFIGGGNGAYYLVLVRNILEKSDLVYREFPLLFWLEAALAFIPLKLGLMDMNSAIDFAARIFDSLIPPLSVFPAYLLVRKLAEEEKPFTRITIAATSVLFVSFFVLTSDFQKNALGLLWLFCLLYWLLKLSGDKSIRNFAFAGLFFLLTALTHYGCTIVAMLIVAVNLLVTRTIQFGWKSFLKTLVSVWLIILAAMVVVYYISPWRLNSLLEAPEKIFHQPVLFSILKNEPVISPIDVITIALVNSIALIALFVVIKRAGFMNKTDRGFILSMIVVSLFLASPFLSFEYAQRLYFISYISMIPLLAYIAKQADKKQLRNFIAVALFMIPAASTFFGLAKENYSNMNRNLLVELTKMKNVLPQEDKSLIVARHGLEYWSTWIFRNMAVRQEELSADYWRWYNKIYFIVQKKDKAPFGPAGLFGKPFPEPNIPEKSYKIFESTYFDLYECRDLPEDFSIFN